MYTLNNDEKITADKNPKGKSAVEDILPLTPMQESMLFQYLKNPSSEEYFQQLTLYLYGELDVEGFKKAWCTVAQKNEALRSVIKWENLNQPVQVIFKEQRLKIREYDFSSIDEGAWREKVVKMSEEDRMEGLDIEKEPFRISLLKMPGHNYAVIISGHHILYDGWSNGILLTEFFEAYNRYIKGIKPSSEINKLKIRDYIKWTKTLDKEHLAEFWKNYLCGFDKKTRLPVSTGKKEAQFGTEEFTFDLSLKLSEKVKSFAREKNFTPATLFFAAWGILLQKIDNSKDVVFGVTVSGRNLKLRGIENTVGLFINTIPVRFTAAGDEKLSKCLEELNRALIGREEFECCSLSDIKDVSEINNRENLFDSIIAFENYPLDTKLLNSEGNFRITDYEVFEKSNFDLSVSIMNFEKMKIKFIYNRGTFEKSCIEDLSRRFTMIIEEMVDKIEKPLFEVETLEKEEREFLLSDLNNTVSKYPKRKTLQKLFEEQVEKRPDAVALKLEDIEMTYGELNERANRLAALLINKGVKSNETVGILFGRSFEMIISILAVLKAGGAYLPLDPDNPVQRSIDMIRSTKTGIVLMEKSLGERLFPSRDVFNVEWDIETLVYEEITEKLSEYPASNPVCKNISCDTAYVMYTSGSTGTPKGIQTSHYNISRVVKDTNYIEILPSDIILQLSNYAFDGSTFDIFGALLNGAKLVLTKKETFLDMAKLTGIIKDEGITVFFITTALFNALVDADAQSLKNIRKVLFGGERISTIHAAKALEAAGQGKIVHVYGPTETTTFATYFPIDNIDNSSVTIPIGKPISNTEIYVLDKNLKPVFSGCLGELYIAGDGVAKGYINDVELTSMRFIKHLFKSKGFMYKTGDIVRMLPGGDIEFIERADKQVKIRGFRIEPGEIEACLNAHEDIGEAVVNILKDVDGNQYICAYVAVKKELTGDEVRNFLSKELPAYMIPSKIVLVDKIPVTSNGKVDFKKLSEYVNGDECEALYEEPKEGLEMKLADIWQQVLKVQKVGANDDFYSLGGHSLKATMLASKIKKELGFEVPLAILLKNTTVRLLANCISDLNKADFKPIEKAVEQEYYPVTAAQKSIFVQKYSDDVGTLYNMPLSLSIKGHIDEKKLVNSIKLLVKRHEALRTSFHMLEGEIVQKINGDITMDIPVIDACDESIDRLINEAAQPFELSIAPLMRSKLFKLSDVEHVLFLDMHHIVSDGITVKILIEELISIYEGKELEELKVQYKDYTMWHLEQVKSERYAKMGMFWNEMLKGEIPVLNMHLDMQRHDKRSFIGNSYKFDLSQKQKNELERLAKKNRVTLNNVLAAAYYILLNRYTGQHDIIIGSLVAGRSEQDTWRMAGMFNNFLPLRMEIDTNADFESFLTATGDMMIKAYANQDYSFDNIVENNLKDADASRNPFFDTMLILHNQFDSLNIIKLGEASLSNREVVHNTSKLDFKLDIVEEASGELKCILEYSVDLFYESTIERLAQHFTNIINEVLSNPKIKINEIEMLSENERLQLLNDFNSTKVEYSKEKTIYDFLTQQAEETPDRTAVFFGEESVSYSELDRRSNRLAEVLRNKGVTRDSVVAVMLDRSVSMAVSLFGIHKAGGAYMPISPEYPLARIDYMLEDSGAVLLITEEAHRSKIGEYVNTVFVDDPEVFNGEAKEIQKINEPNDLAYVIYTSGSTGKPKGAMIEHYSMVNRLNWMQNSFPIGESDVILQKTPFTFDVSVWELFWWAMAGAKVCFLKPGGEKEPSEIINAIEKYKITTMHFVPSMLSAFLTYVENGIDIIKLKSLRQVFASGEALGAGLVNKFNRLFAPIGTKLINLYGPTEATVDVSWFDCSYRVDFDTIPIGKPIHNIRLYVLDSKAKLQPIGVPGELHIGGDGLARGYLGRPELTVEKFIADPFYVGERIYRTGDLAKWLPDGNIEYLGRLDNQIKIRGFRIELGEIESELIKIKDIRNAAVKALEDSAGDKYLCGYIEAGEDIDIQDIRERLANVLPYYMMPSNFVVLDKMPLTPNGKVDGKALPKPSKQDKDESLYEAPTNSIEEKLIEIWKEVLGIDKKIGINDDFFRLGGHSLKAAGLAVKIHRDFGVGVTIGEIFNAPTVKELAFLISESEEKDFEEIGKIEIHEYYPVSSSQKRLFIINRLEGDNTVYNLPSMSIIEGELDIERFKLALEKLVQRHESLRTSFKLFGEIPAQIVHDNMKIDFDYCEAIGEEPEKIAERFISPFNLEVAPLFRVALVKMNTARYFLMFDMHHIIADGVSSVILAKEFISLYMGESVPELKIQFKDFAAWQNSLESGDELRRQEEYWLDRFKGEIPVLNLPSDYQRPAVQSSEGDKYTFSFDKKTLDGIRELALRKGATLYMVLLAAYNTLLYKYTGQEDIVVGSPTAGRQHADVENVVGMFVNTLALRSFPGGDKSFTLFLDEVRENAMKAYENQDYQFERLVDTLQIPRDISRNPLFDTMFVLQNMGIPTMEFENVRFLPYKVESKTSKFDLTMEVVENEEDLAVNIEYCTRLFKPETIERMAGHFKNIVDEVINNAELTLDEIDMLSKAEHEQIINVFNSTLAEYDKEKPVYKLFEEQTLKTPNNVAAIFGEDRVTYRELNLRADKLAAILQQNGVGRDSIAAIMLDRSILMEISILAVHKAGGAYLPISSEYPDDRILYMLEDSNAVVLLTNRAFDSKSGDGIKKIFVEDAGIYEESAGKQQVLSKPNDLAYVIYTSGSTGKPKGAMIEHYSLVNRLNWMQKAYPIGDGDVILQKTPFTFDVSVWELFWWGMTGAAVCFLEPGGEKNPEVILEAIDKNKVTVMHFVPSMLNAFLEYLGKGADLSKLKSLKRVFCSGEALHPAQVKKFNSLLTKANGTTLHNLYGPTEATIDVSYFDCPTVDEVDIVPIGKPIDNTSFYILGNNNVIQPVGVPGELHLAGDGLARGYINRPELNKEKFVKNPFKEGEMLYRTGDIARWLPDGNVEYIGRKDNQVKVRGFRIELGEIETELLKHEDITDAAVVARENSDKDMILYAYFVAGRELTVNEIREFLSKNLPAYMIPSYFIKLDKIPLTSSGKVDRKELPQVDGGIETGTEYVAPTNEVEEKLLEIWKEILGLDKIGINDRFFELGGYSILLIKMHSKVEELYPGKVKITDLFAYPTISMIAEFINSQKEETNKEISLKGVPFSKEYFGIEAGANKEMGFNLNIDLATHKSLKEAAAVNNIEISDILISVGAYLISQISEETNTVFQVSLDESDTFSSISIELGQINKFEDLFKEVFKVRKSVSADASYRTEDLKRKVVAKDTYEIVPLFYKSENISASFALLDVFDIAFEYGEEECTTLYIRFNGNRLSKAKMKEFAALYLKILSLFLK
ncbi:non-ribosomal peptide synthetase [Acetivibrio cellulolyticus]|uniref:non-ribosomal peptide synthetase n=1 Tax=Acetivibrio cellulolyticus TaxID=35830 RepID=UPI0001E301B4|nr:non-ribosomal peptide synthetase [Acetivibrio cellulolyticus]